MTSEIMLSGLEDSWDLRARHEASRPPLLSLAFLIIFDSMRNSRQWPGFFFFFFFKREGESKHLDETDVYSSHLWWYSSLWWTDGVLHRLVLSNRSLKTLHNLVAIWIIGSISSLEQIRLDDALDLRCLCI